VAAESETVTAASLADGGADTVNAERCASRGPDAATAGATGAAGAAGETPSPAAGPPAGAGAGTANAERPASPRSAASTAAEPPASPRSAASTAAEPPARTRPAEPPPAGSDEPARAPAPGAPRREGTPGFVDAVEADPSAVSEPADPADPVVSANATGIADTADPIPNATAKAPTRPTCRANPDCTAASDAPTARRPYSIARTRPRRERRSRPTDDNGAELTTIPLTDHGQTMARGHSPRTPVSIADPLFFFMSLRKKSPSELQRFSSKRYFFCPRMTTTDQERHVTARKQATANRQDSRP